MPDDAEEVALDKEDKRKLEALNKVLSESKTSNQSTYSFGTGAGPDIEFEITLSYCLGSRGMYCPAALRMVLISTCPRS